MSDIVDLENLEVDVVMTVGYQEAAKVVGLVILGNLVTYTTLGALKVFLSRREQKFEEELS